jgi:LMBR1 domain-containing protein 1
MALIQTSLIWVAYAAAVVLLLAIAAIFVFVYQTPRDRAASVSTVCIITTTALLATVLLLPVDVALTSSTSLSSKGRKKDWATPDHVDSIVKTLTIVYYTLYSLDALLCLVVVPFTYFWYEEYDEDAAETGEQTVGQRLWGAFKYTIAFILFVVIIFLIGFFVPFAKKAKGDDRLDLDFFKHLLKENHGERALTFALGFLSVIGTLVYVVYTGAGLALLPVALIKSAPSISTPALAANTASQLEQNRERQRQLEGRNEGRDGGLDSRDRRELESLIREERTLIRRERLAAESTGEHHFLVKAWTKIEAVFRPLKLLGGLILIIVALTIFASMLITGIDKAKNSVCKARCGYILAYLNIFQPINWALVKSAKVFPIDYVLFLLLVMFFFCSSVVGIATVGIRFLWVTLFKIRKGHTSPQALLMATVLLTLMVLAINYSVAMVVAPQYATFGPQTFCDRPSRHPGEQPDCSHHKSAIKPCTELSANPSAKEVCTPSVLSTFINRITINFPFFGAVLFWAQFAFLGVYLAVFVTTLFKTPHLDTDQLDADLEEEEEEGLLASTGRRFGATWQDITGRAKGGSGYGAVDRNGGERS